MSSAVDRLNAAAAAKELVQIQRGSFEPRDRRAQGYALAVSKSLVLLSTISTRIDLDGYEVFRLEDVTACEDHFPQKAFLLKAMELKGQSARLPADLDLTSIPTLLASAQRQFPLLVIHREKAFPGECDIGRLKLTSDDAFAIHYINPSAEWAPDPGHYRYSDVTRVGFGDEYAKTLALVAGVAV